MPPSPQQGRSRAAMPVNGVFAVAVCLLAVAAAVISFVRGSWLGIVWVLLAGVSSNMAWYYIRRARTASRGRQGNGG